MLSAIVSIAIVTALNSLAILGMFLLRRRNIQRRKRARNGRGSRRGTGGTPELGEEIKCQIKVQDSDDFEVAFRPALLEENYFVFSLHKSGSTLLNGMIATLARRAGIPVVSLPSMLFKKGIPSSDILDTDGMFEHPGVLYGDFRNLSRDLGVTLSPNSKAVLLVRDPRDCLVSLYFSLKNSHKIPDSGKIGVAMAKNRDALNNQAVDIDEFVVAHAGKFVKEFEEYHRDLIVPHGDRVLFHRYEDVIFEKVAWLNEINEFYGWNVRPNQVEKIAGKKDVRPTDEDVTRHVRKVTPGDHREKLKPETIEKLDEIYRDVLKPFGYDL